MYDEATAEEACELLAPVCERVRIMPFVEGVPCSVHGLVAPDGVAIFRPVEMITLRRPGAGFVYAGTSTFWDPEPAAREAMRSLARRVAGGLAESVGFRGAFTLDGVLGADGFVPTELNARLGAGFMHLAEALPELPLGPLALAAQHGEALDYRPRELERLVNEAADLRRSGSGRLVVAAGSPEQGGCALVRDGNRFRVAEPGEKADGALAIGPAVGGRFVFFRPRTQSVAAGASLAPDVVRAFELADEWLGTDIGTLVAAPVVACDASPK